MLKLAKTAVASFAGDVVSFGVESDKGSITAVSENPGIAYLKRLGEGKYLLVLKSVGSTRITVTAGGETAAAEVSVREAKRSDPDGKWRIFVGDTHAHTSYSDGLATPYEVFPKVKDEEFFDFFTVTDHTELLDDGEFYNTFVAADAYTDEGFTSFAGSESQVDLYHKNSIGRDENGGGEIVVINKEGYSYSDSLDTFFSDIGESPMGLAIVAHPHIIGFTDTPVLWKGFDPVHQTDERMKALIRGVEIFNEKNDSNMINEHAFFTFLDCGYKVSPYGASDHHGPRWGKVAMPVRTFIYSEGRSKELMLDAMQNARTYACENGNVKLFYTCNGKNPATTLPLTDTYEFLVHQEPFYVVNEADETVYAEVVSDYGEVVAAREVGKHMYDFDFTVHSATARYFYLRLYSRIGEKTVSAPIYTGREYDPCPRPRFEKTAINDADFKVKAFSGGTNGFAAIHTNTADYCQLRDANGEILIDMGRVRRLSAVGYFTNEPIRNDLESYAAFISRLEYYVSTDAIRFERVARDRIGLYGCEHITEFAPVEARYVKLRSLATVGSEMRKERFHKVGAAIGALRFYE
ncbi:MAG: hypothetical protein J6J66_00595 [Clostridia bacterium]|nr:hypothetical protein [Clostridia bacterium]